VRNLEAVEALGVGAGDYRQDGDLAAYTPEALTQRQRLRHDADVLRLMGAFFDALSETFEKVAPSAGKFTLFLNKGKHEAEKRREEKAADAVAAAMEGELSLPRAIRATARLNETLATSATSAKAAIEALGGLKARRDAEERKLRVYERRLHKAPPEVVVAHSPTPLVKLNELLDTSVDATFATFETRRVNWSEQLELGRVSPTSRTRLFREAGSKPGTAHSYDSEYRGSSAYSVSQYRLDTAPGEPTASPPSRRLDSPRARRPPRPRTKLEIALAVDPKLVEPVKTLSRVPTTPASPRG